MIQNNIIFHHRPDLLDWRQVERREVRERIDLAFHVMDRWPIKKKKKDNDKIKK